MKLKLTYFCLFLSVVVACSSSAPKIEMPAVPTGQSKSAEAGGFKLRDYKSETWANGLEVVTIENHALPSMSFGLLLKTGAASDPMGKSGLMRMMSQLLTRGAGGLNAMQLVDSVGQLGSEFETDVEEDFSWVQLGGLSQSEDQLLALFSDVILRPRFDQKELEKEKTLTLSAIHQLPDHPDDFAELAFLNYLYGTHPYGSPASGTEIDVKSISRADVIRAYKHYMVPNNAVLVVTGDFTDAFMTKVKSTFAGWSQREVPPVVFPKVAPISGTLVRLIDKKDLTQSQIVFGQVGIRRDDPDYLLLRVANTILGGTFSSRLMSEVRVKRGLTYGIDSSYDAREDRGPFEISTFTKNATVGVTLDASLEVIKKFFNDGVNKDEVESAKNYLMGAFPRAIETPEKLGFNLAVLRRYKISDDYLKNFVSNVNAVEASSVNDAIKRHLDPNDFKIVIFSNADQALPQIHNKTALELKKINEIL